MEDFTLKPVKLRIDIYGSGNFGGDVPFPDVYINDALSQTSCISVMKKHRVSRSFPSCAASRRIT